MSKYIILIVCLTVALLSATNAATDDEKKLLAAGPLIINPMPGYSQWMIDITYSDADKPGNPPSLARLQKAAEQDSALAQELKNPQFLLILKDNRAKRIVVTKTGNIRHEQILTEAGEAKEAWRIDDVEVDRNSVTNKWDAKIMSGFPTHDFAELEWISKDNFVGIDSLNGHKYFTFREDRRDDTGAEIGTAEAFIDTDTRYPAYFRFITEVRQYTILQSPTAPLAVPGEVTSAENDLMARIQKATPHLSAP
jgi:hypothetical protein